MKLNNLVTLRAKTLEDLENIWLDQHFILREMESFGFLKLHILLLKIFFMQCSLIYIPLSNRFYTPACPSNSMFFFPPSQKTNEETKRSQTSIKQTSEKGKTHKMIAVTTSTHTWNPFCVGQTLSRTGVPCPGVGLIQWNSINENCFFFLSLSAGINFKKAY